MRDYCENQQFRRDYWVKGLTKISPVEQRELLLKERVILSAYRELVPLLAKGSRGEIPMTEAVYRPLLDLLEDYRPHSLAEIEQTLRPHGITFAKVLQSIMILAGGGYVSSVQEEGKLEKARIKTQAFNRYMLERMRTDMEIAFLASPVTGAGVSIPRMAMLFILARENGRKTDRELAQFAWDNMKLFGQKLSKSEGPIETEEGTIEELTYQAQLFREQQVVVLEGLGIL